MKAFISAVGAAALCLTASAGRAAEVPAPRPRNSVTFETYAYSGTLNGQTTSVFAPALFASFPLSERVSLNAAWLFAYAPSRGGAPASFQAGNPSIGPSVVLLDDAWKVRTGGGLVLPFTLLSDPDEQGSALLRRAATLRGNSGFSLVAPGLLGFTPWADAALRQGSFRFLVDFRVPMSAQLSEKRGRRVDAVFQLSGTPALDVHPNVLVGSTFQAIYVATAAEGSDPVFLAVIPSVRLHGRAGFIEARLTLNLDEPLGFAFSQDGISAL
ncbi:hypothetical protein HPC49_49710, partial [Pyxidicoccus fallax]|uniref:hypothetical protein n=1 Tax=Pyxidicoccus fallax TaxID=394095 RepID=UPI0014945F64